METTLLRISGAIQVLEELSDTASKGAGTDAAVSSKGINET
jgi:hypothetical protein